MDNGRNVSSNKYTEAGRIDDGRNGSQQQSKAIGYSKKGSRY